MIPTGGEGESTDHTNFCHHSQKLVGRVSQETDSEMLRLACRSFYSESSWDQCLWESEENRIE